MPKKSDKTIDSSKKKTTESLVVEGEVVDEKLASDIKANPKENKVSKEKTTLEEAPKETVVEKPVETKSAKTPPPPVDNPPASQAESGKSGGLSMVITTLAMLLALAALVGVYLLYKQMSNTTIDNKEISSSIEKNIAEGYLAKDELVQINANLDSSKTEIANAKTKLENSITNLKQLIDTTNNSIDEQKNSLSEEFAKTAEQIDTTSQKITDIDSRISGLEEQQNLLFNAIAEIPTQKTLFRLIEIVQLQRQALRYLELDKNPKAALYSLEMALGVLNDMQFDGQAVFLEKVQATMVDLRAQSQVNPIALSQDVVILGTSLAKLPLRAEAKQEGVISEWQDGSDSEMSISDIVTSENADKLAQAKEWLLRLWVDFTKELKTLVIVYPEDQPLIPPSGEFFIRQNVAQSINTIYHAALQRNETVYQQEFNRLRKWLDLYYEKTSESDNIRSEIKKLQEVSLSVDSQKLKFLLKDAQELLSENGGQ